MAIKIGDLVGYKDYDDCFYMGVIYKKYVLPGYYVVYWFTHDQDTDMDYPENVLEEWKNNVYGKLNQDP